MSSPIRGLENVPPEDRYRSPEERACLDMIRIINEAEELRAVATEQKRPTKTLVDRLVERNLDCEEQIAAAIRRFTWEGFVVWYEEAVKGRNRDQLWEWADMYGDE